MTDTGAMGHAVAEGPVLACSTAVVSACLLLRGRGQRTPYLMINYKAISNYLMPVSWGDGESSGRWPHSSPLELLPGSGVLRGPAMHFSKTQISCSLNGNYRLSPTYDGSTHIFLTF